MLRPAKQGKIEDKTDHKEGHRERLKQRFMRAGLEGMNDYEIVELLLTLGTPRRDCKIPAKAAISAFGNLKGVLEASEAELTGIPGIGQVNAVPVQLIRSIAERLVQDRTVASGVHYSSADDVYNYLKLSLACRKQEVFKVLFLDNSNQLLDQEDMFQGTVNRSAVYTREVMHQALRRNATGLIFAHNHPSGNLEPSPEDRNLTRQLVFAAIFMQIKVLDHLIITQDGYFSFSAHGLLENFEAEYIKLNMPG